MIVEGYVRKNHAGQDFSRTNHRRYFVAEGFRVFYYTDAKKTSVKGHFDLRNVIQIRPYGGASSKVGPGAIVVQIAEPNYAGPHKNMVISFLDKRAAWLTLFCSATVPDYVEESLRQYVDKGLAESLNARYGAAEAVSAYRSVFERFLTRRTPTVAVLTPRIGQKGGVSVPQALPQPIPQPADADLDSPRGGTISGRPLVELCWHRSPRWVACGEPDESFCWLHASGDARSLCGLWRDAASPHHDLGLQWSV